MRDPGYRLYALSYFEDAERAPMPDMLWGEGWPEIRAAGEDGVRGIAGRG